jgi:hypothetical protein
MAPLGGLVRATRGTIRNSPRRLALLSGRGSAFGMYSDP